MKNFLLLSSFFLLLSANVMGQNEKLKANYIYNIIKYVNWPESYKTGDFIIGVLGNSPVTAELKKIAATKKVFAQSISVVVFNSTNEITKCNVLFITGPFSSLIKETLANVGSNSTLIIGESPGLATSGAGINFITKDDALGFELNEVAIKRRNLQVDSKLKNMSL